MSILLIGNEEKALGKITTICGRPILNNDPRTIIIECLEQNLGIEEIRLLKRQITLKTIDNEARVVIIKDAQKLTDAAQNSLLKTLEEPPENTAIYLIAPSPDFFLPTVLSRCQIIFMESEIRKLSDDEKQKAGAVFELIKNNNLLGGFAWAKKITDRKAAILEIDTLLIYSHDNLHPAVLKKLFKTKKYLNANTNVRLTLENLFVA